MGITLVVLLIFSFSDTSVFINKNRDFFVHIFKTQKLNMEFLPGNSQEDWQFLGKAENAIPYQHVTLYQHMHWKDFPLQYFIPACSKFSGMR